MKSGNVYSAIKKLWKTFVTIDGEFFEKFKGQEKYFLPRKSIAYVLNILILPRVAEIKDIQVYSKIY